MPRELEDQLKGLEWPPKVKVDTEEGVQEIELTELDVNWLFCTVLGMRWSDATSVTDNLERRFLYNKAMEVATEQAQSANAIEEEKARMEAKIDEQLKNIGDSIRPPQL